MESRLVEYFADEFNKQVGNGVDVRKFPKAMAKLKKQVKRTKEILSANTVAPISIESLYDDRDFRSVDSTQFIKFFLFTAVFLPLLSFFLPPCFAASLPAEQLSGCMFLRIYYSTFFHISPL